MTEPTYTEADRDQLLWAAEEITRVIRDISHHEIGDSWELSEDTPTEIARLRQRLDELDAATAKARKDIELIEMAARVRAVWAPTLEAWDVVGPDPDGDEVLYVAQDLLDGKADTAAAAESVLTDAAWPDTLADRTYDATPPGTLTEHSWEEAMVSAEWAISAVAAALYGPAPTDTDDAEERLHRVLTEWPALADPHHEPCEVWYPVTGSTTDRSSWTWQPGVIRERVGSNEWRIDVGDGFTSVFRDASEFRRPQ